MLWSTSLCRLQCLTIITYLKTKIDVGGVAALSSQIITASSRMLAPAYSIHKYAKFWKKYSYKIAKEIM